MINAKRDCLICGNVTLDKCNASCQATSKNCRTSQRTHTRTAKNIAAKLAILHNYTLKHGISRRGGVAFLLA